MNDVNSAQLFRVLFNLAGKFVKQAVLLHRKRSDALRTFENIHSKIPPAQSMREGWSLCLRQSETDRNGGIYTVHHILVQTSHMLAQTPLVDGADLFEQNDGVFGQADFPAV